jgi:nucleotide-binding universal stress UspA family protein
VRVTRGHADAAGHLEAERRGDGERPMIVVGVDGTSAGVAALRWAVGQARRTDGRVLAIAVSEPPPLTAGGPEIASSAIALNMSNEQMTVAADRWMTEAIAALPLDAGRAVERQVVSGDAANVLLETARGADLLVLGNHGRGALAGALAGSVAQRCAHHATCPLVLVPAPEGS